MVRETWFIDQTSTDPYDNETQLIEAIWNPPRRWARRPDWLQQLETIDPDLKDTLDEVYSATNDQQFRLLAMGVRTALDQVMVKIVGDVGDFKAKLKAMVANGHLTQRQSDSLSTVIDAGSAAAHRGFKPQIELLKEMLITMESVIRNHYITGPMLGHMRTLIPPRP